MTKEIILEAVLERVSIYELQPIVENLQTGDSFSMEFDPEKTYFFVSKDNDTLIEELTEETAQSLVELLDFLANEAKGQSILEALSQREQNVDLKDKAFEEVLSLLVQ